VDITNYNSPANDQKARDQGTPTQRHLTPKDEIVTPKHVPVIPLSPEKDAPDQAAGCVDVAEHTLRCATLRFEPGSTGRFNRYDGTMVRSILRRRTGKSVKSERRKPGFRITFAEEIATLKSPPKWYLDLLLGTTDKDQEAEVEIEEKEPESYQQRLIRPGTPCRPRRDTPTAPVASRWRG